MKFPFIHKRITPLFPITFIVFFCLVLLVVFLPPTFTVSTPLFSFSILYILFLLVFLLFFGIGTLVFKSRSHGLLLSSFVIVFLILRLNDLKHPLFLALLIALFITLEFFFAQTNKKPHVPHAQKDQVRK
jgi:hypothetical protein